VKENPVVEAITEAMSDVSVETHASERLQRVAARLVTAGYLTHAERCLLIARELVDLAHARITALRAMNAEGAEDHAPPA
jgi:hypothetical protein